MMGGGPDGWYGAGHRQGDARWPQAVRVANVAGSSRPARGEQAASDGPGALPRLLHHGHHRHGKTGGMVSVNAWTGAVWYHGWHGTFVAEQEFGA